MNTQLSSKILGQRIAKLRKFKGLSQEELAKKINISRSSLAQIELGNRNLNALELHQLSIALSFSVDQFLSEDFQLNDQLMSSPESADTKMQERISIPQLQVNKFKNVLLYILERCAGKPNVGETVLYKLLYFSDFNYYEQYEEHLTGANYRKLPFGPVPQKLEAIIHQMIENKEIKRIKTEYHSYTQTRYLPLTNADLTQLKASETAVLDNVIEQFSNWSAKAISDYSHKDMPWMASKDGETINYELVFYRDTPYSVRNYQDEIEEA